MINSNENNSTGNADVICPPDPERIVEGLRDTGYNFNTAVADIIDNSIAAGANRVDITVDINPVGEIKVCVADNGSGMDEDGLTNAMKYGSRARTEEGSLGKFGLGLKTASTAFCRSLSVVTRGTDGIIRKAQWDLDYIAETNQWNLRMPSISRDEENILNSTAEDGTGTLVIWEKVDRLIGASYKNKANEKNALRKKIDDLRFHISMVYQRFLDSEDTRGNNVTITLNGEPVDAWDPFVTGEELTELLAEDELSITLPDETSANATLRAFMLPNAKSFSTSEAKDRARIGNDMQGFYVYRENRLIHYGDWLGMFTKESHLSLLRVEFSFDHRLDDAFNVDIKKSRILPADEIMDYIRDQFISAPRRAAEERYRHGVTKAVTAEAEGKDAHAESNRNIDEKAGSVEAAKITVTEGNNVKIENKNGTFSHSITVIQEPKPGQLRVIAKPDLEYGQLWEPCIADGNHAVQINQSHPYYQKIYEPVLSQNVMVTGMDALLWALAEAEHSTYNDAIKEQYEDIRITVSRILKTLVADLPDPDLGDDE